MCTFPCVLPTPHNARGGPTTGSSPALSGPLATVENHCHPTGAAAAGSPSLYQKLWGRAVGRSGCPGSPPPPRGTHTAGHADGPARKPRLAAPAPGVRAESRGKLLRGHVLSVFSGTSPTSDLTPAGLKGGVRVTSRWPLKGKRPPARGITLPSTRRHHPVFSLRLSEKTRLRTHLKLI